MKIKNQKVPVYWITGLSGSGKSTVSKNLIKLLNAESQINQSIFFLIEKFYVLLNNKYWIKDYIFWELELFSILGYDLKFENVAEKKIINKELR